MKEVRDNVFEMDESEFKGFFDIFMKHSYQSSYAARIHWANINAGGSFELAGLCKLYKDNNNYYIQVAQDGVIK